MTFMDQAIPSPITAAPSMTPEMSSAPAQDGDQSGVPAKDQTFFNEVVRMAKKQAAADAKTIKYFVNIFKYGQFKEGEGASANFTFSDVSLLMSVLFARDPNIVVSSHNVGDLPAFDMLVQMGLFPNATDAQKAYGEVLEKVEDFAWRDTKSAVHVNAALFNAIVTGLGVIKLSFDDSRSMARIDSLGRDEVFIDPAARYDLSQAKYIIQCCVKEKEEAQAFFNSIGSQYMVKPNYKLSDSETLAGSMAKANEPEGGIEGQRYFRFYEIWVKQPDGSRKILYRDYDKDDYIFSRDWPFILDVDEFPFALLMFNQQYQQVQDAFTDLLTVNGLRIAYENIVEFYRQHVFKSIATKLIYDKAAFPDNDFDTFLDNEDMKAIGANLGDKPLDKVVQAINFNEDAGTIIDLATSLKDIKDEIFGISEIQRGMAGKKLTAKQAGIQDNWGSQRLDRRQKLFDMFLEDILLKRTRVDLLLASSEKIARVVGPPGQLLWDLFDGDIEELHCLYAINVAAGSTGQDAKDKKIESMERAIKLMDSINQTQPMPVFDTVKLGEELLKQYDIPHPETYILGPVMPKDAGILPPPGGPAPSGNPPAAQGPHGVGPGGNAPAPTMPNESEPGAPRVH
jgi:hypothetical protein